MLPWRTAGVDLPNGGTLQPVRPQRQEALKPLALDMPLALDTAGPETDSPG